MPVGEGASGLISEIDGQRPDTTGRTGGETGHRFRGTAARHWIGAVAPITGEDHGVAKRPSVRWPKIRQQIGRIKTSDIKDRADKIKGRANCGQRVGDRAAAQVSDQKIAVANLADISIDQPKIHAGGGDGQLGWREAHAGN